MDAATGPPLAGPQVVCSLLIASYLSIHKPALNCVCVAMLIYVDLSRMRREAIQEQHFIDLRNCPTDSSAYRSTVAQLGKMISTEDANGRRLGYAKDLNY